jgi:hypothetical protein
VNERKIHGRALGRVSNGAKKRCSGTGVRSLNGDLAGVDLLCLQVGVDRRDDREQGHEEEQDRSKSQRDDREDEDDDLDGDVEPWSKDSM